MTMPNIYEPQFDVTQDAPPYHWQRARLGRQAGSKELGASLFDVPPGAEMFPNHAHMANEELMLVIDGEPTLRTPEGERRLARGEVVAFLAGPAGTHHVRNDTDALVRVVVLSTMKAPEINLFPDSDELWVRDYVPGTDPPADAVEIRVPMTPPGA
ncbi:cupin domain-containing protein [Baekduia soli]|uniref:Cupin domain-containing protein n=1 Tax=Baekduia soli TaxID=496014 RepID=A0A5B8U6U3_9ACTN|nr:cupin domain-containing protein [Baekduia soli]QEC48816.1 cupin domain-containing protein [Baekduia soli]